MLRMTSKNLDKKSMAAIYIVLKRELLQVKQQIPYDFTPLTTWFFQWCPILSPSGVVKWQWDTILATSSKCCVTTNNLNSPQECCQRINDFNTSYLPPDRNEIFLKQSAEVLLCGASEEGAGAWTLSVLLPSSSLLLLPLELGDWLLLWLLSLPLSLPLEWSGLGSWSRYASKEWKE